MTEDLNHFAKYQTYSSYLTIYNDTDSHSKTQRLNRNPLEYYTKRGLDPPKTIYGDPAQILNPQAPQKQDQGNEANAVGTIHYFANEIDRLCFEVGKLLQKPQAIKEQLNTKKKMSQEQHKNHPSSDMQIQTLKQIKSLNNLNPSIQRLYTEQLLQEQQQDLLEYRIDGQKQDLQIVLPTQNQFMDWQSPNVQNQLQRNEKPYLSQQKSVRQLYQRSHKSTMIPEEGTKRVKQNKRTQGGSLAELALHKDEEIQKAIKILQGGLKK
ncbi:unnamed protein product (macronuclear) [Paramecium tetraurelia]|uniref:Uncharacterized protein n=1 Tax=Paramecium tetraurelia TaxID=5888 RepID=A0CLN1_PARTE|nr:uncharacterized protein GSPATT00008247001 [Paramecium tetraurelia]CAK71698.1 unnamed protein product [Paramecium tetraurelia]|eukprot:XP_001439095.1 hypothetical protein (macronuclear) [Paramecium tetraurelia strain d4-2]